MALTTRTNSLRIEFWNIDPKSKDCDALFRRSLKKEVVDVLSGFSDSTEYKHAPCKGLKIVQTSTYHKFIVPDHMTDSIFNVIKSDSIKQQQHLKDSVAFASVEVSVQLDSPIVNLARAHMKVDSISELMVVDSLAEFKAAVRLFKDQINLKDRKGLLDTKLECVSFLLEKKIRSNKEVLAYLSLLQNFCIHRQDLYRAVKVILPDEQKATCMAYFKKARDECSKIQYLIEKIEIASEPIKDFKVNK
jgi:hypothetical protein